MTAQESAVKKIRSLSTDQLIDAFEATDSRNDAEIPVVRGWIMDELETRNAQAFEAWLEANTGSPRNFF